MAEVYFRYSNEANVKDAKEQATSWTRLAFLVTADDICWIILILIFIQVFRFAIYLVHIVIK